MSAEETAPFYLIGLVVALIAVIGVGALRSGKSGRLKPWVDSGK